MKTILLLFALLILNTGFLRSQLSQEWVRSYNGPLNGNDEAMTHTNDDAGNIYAAGKVVGSATGFDIYIVKYNSSGNILWEQIYNGPGNGNDIPYSIVLDISGNVFVAAESKGVNTNNDYLLIKYNNAGEEQWNRRYNGESNSMDIPVAVATDNFGNSVISGMSWEAASLFDIVTIQYNSEGTLQWKRKYNGPEGAHEIADDLAVDGSGNVYVSGSGIGSGTLNDFIIIKYDVVGYELWTNRYNGPVNGNDNATSLTFDNSGNIIITGSSIGSGTSLDFATIKYSPTGKVLWTKRYTSSTVNAEEPKEITSDNNGNIYIAGTSTGFESSYDFFTVKYSADGEVQWAKNYNGPSSINFDEARSVTADNFGNVFVAGFSAGTGTMDDIVIVKYDDEGNESWVNRYNSPANRDDIASDISLDASGNVIVSGVITSLLTSKDFAVIKFSQLTNINNISNEEPSGFYLSQNYPNPFNPATNLEFGILNLGFVSLKIYDMLGKEVATLVNSRLNPGTYNYNFDASGLVSGIYFYMLTVLPESGMSGFSEVKRMMLVK